MLYLHFSFMIMVEIRVENSLSNIIRNCSNLGKIRGAISPLFSQGRAYGAGG
jgi:hypothetical protein